MFNFRAWIRKFTQLVTYVARRKRSTLRVVKRRSFCLQLESLEPRLVPSSFTVTTTADTGGGSLRSAINFANSQAQTNIVFHILTDDPNFNSVSNSFTIQPLSPLPAITAPVTIDGTTEPAYLTQTYLRPMIVLDGTNAGSSSDGLDLNAATSTINGLAIDNFGGSAINLSGSVANNDVIQGNYLGVTPDGATESPNETGILIAAGASDNTIGGTTPAARNIISGNTGDGVDIYGSGTSNNLVEGNFIGTNASSSTTLGNTGPGVDIEFGASDNIIGGPAAGNVIANNGNTGVIIDATAGAGTTGNIVEGDYIGTDPAGDALGNDSGLSQAGGVLIVAASGNTIGGTASGDRNVISENVGDGLDIEYSGLTILGGHQLAGGNLTVAIPMDNVVEGNFIGTNPSGTAALPNTGAGLSIIGGSDNTIGGAASGAGNVISGNGADGVDISGTAFTYSHNPFQYALISADDNIVEGNFIGTNPGGTAALPNTGAGLSIVGGSNNTIGGAASGAGNVISGNGADGVDISETAVSSPPFHDILMSANDNVVEGNFIGTNPDGTAALPNTGAGLSIFGGSDNTIGGAARGAGNVISGNGADGVDISEITIPSFPFSNVLISANDNVVEGNFIGTNSGGTDALPNTGAGLSIVGGSDNTIGGAASGAGNVIAGNNLDGIDIYGSGTSNNVVDGDYIGTNAVSSVTLGNSGPGVEIEYGASDNTIGGTTALAGNVISDNGNAGVIIDDTFGVGTTGNIVEGDYIGTDPAGDSLGNDGGGMSIVAAGGNTIGGAAAGEGNVISDNVGDGLDIDNSGTMTPQDNVVEGNFIGTNPGGTAALPNTGAGLSIIGGSDNTIGGAESGAGNVISGNGADGLDIVVATYTNSNPHNPFPPPVTVPIGGNDNVVEGNLIGTNPGGTAALPNTGAGLSIIGGSDNTIGGAESGAGNVISGNGADGVDISGRSYTAFNPVRLILINAADNVFEGNFIGTTAADAVLGNDGDGVNITSGVGNTIGGAAPGVGNVISANAGDGVDIAQFMGLPVLGARISDTVVEGNFIGTDAESDFDLGNGKNGVFVSGTENTIGGSSTGDGNVISGNGNNGVEVTGASSNVIEGNFIGTDATGTAHLGNGGDGVLLTNGATLNTVEGNVIDFNLGFGIEISNAFSTGNFIHGNSIFNNGSSGIAATGGAGATVTTAVPAIISISTSPTSTSILGSLTNAPDSTFVIDFFANDSGDDGEFFLGSATVETDGSGIASFNSGFPVGSTTSQVFTTTITAFGVSGTQPVNTSLFAVVSAVTPTRHTPPAVSISGPPAVVVGLPAGFTSTVTDSNPGQPKLTYTWTVTGPRAPSGTGTGFTLPSDAVTNEPAFTFTPTMNGKYTVQLMVTDGISVVESNAITLTAGPLGQGVVIDGLTQAIVQPGSTVPLTGKLLATDGATAATYFWAVAQNGTAIATGTAASFTFQPTALGLAQISLTVVDSVGAVSSSSVFVTVVAIPTAPIRSTPTPSVPVPPGTVTITTVTPTTASSTGSTTVFQGTPVSFSAQVSNLAVTGALTYRWTLSGPTGFAPKTGTGPTFGFTPSITGSYSATVVVADNYGSSSQASTVLMVNATQPSVAIMSAAGTVYNTATFTQNLTASVTDPGSNGTYAYKWYLNLALSAQTGANFTFSDNTSNLGNDSVKVVVTDNFGNTATTTTSFQVAMTNMTLTPQGPSAQQILAIAAASGITIDASSLPSTVSVDEVALGSNVTLVGGSGPSILQGDSGFNSLVGGSGPDTLIATSGDTLVASSAMSNLFQINPGAGELATAMPGSQNNTLSFASSTTGVNVNVSKDTAAFPGSPNDSLILSGSFQAIVAGGGNNNLAAGRASKVLLFGGTGNDTLSASGGSSISLIAGSGNDSLSSSGGSFISMLGGSGNDTMTTSGGSSITMFGGTGNDTISASGGSSITLVAGAGNDSLSSSGGTNISMLGGTGNDTMTTSGGSSITMFGGAGHDALLTANGGSSITLVAGMGNETLSSINGTGVLLQAGTSLPGTSIPGTSGNDHLISKGGKSITMFGGTGNDSVSASGGSSITLVAGSGNDSLSSSGGTYISMLGGTGNDTMTTSGGSSITMFGGTGNDTISASGGSSITLVAGSGNDSLSSSGGTYISMLGGTGNDTMTTSGGSSITMFGGTGSDTISASGGSSITLVAGTGNDSLSSSGGTYISMLGGAGNDTLSSTGGSSITMFGGTGNETLSASGGSSISLYGGSGNDSLSTSGGASVSMLGGTGNDTLTSTGGSSITMFGGTGNDSISASGGSSITLVGGTGNDTLTAGLGNDSLTATGGSSISMFGGTGNDSLSASGGSSITLYGGSGNDTLSSSGGTGVSMLGGSGNDTLSSSGGSSITMFGGTGNDHLSNKGGHSITVVGGTGNDTLSSVNGTGVLLQGGTVLLVNGVTVLGAGGNDSLIEKNGKSITLFGGTGNDSLSASGGSSISLIGGTGNDSLSASGGTGISMLGGAGNDTLTSSGGSSITMFGGAGNDTINASGGNGVSIYGQQGDNIYNISGSLSDPILVSINTLATFGQNVAQDDSQTTGVNTIEFPGVTSGIHLDLSNASTGTAITPAEEQAVAPGITLSLTGTLQDVVGTSGADSITAGAGNTTINGGGGNDTLIGGSGDTTLLAGAGNDSLVAGTGNTSFVFNTGSAGVDTIDPLAATGVNTLDFAQFGGAVRLNMASTSIQALGNGLTVTLVNPGALNALVDSASGNDSIIGNNAGDSFHLGTGNDNITGGGGADSFYFSGSQLGSDTINETSSGNTLNFYGFGGPINLNLNQTGTQILDQSAASKLTLTLPNPAAFNSVVGTPYADAIMGNTGTSAATIIGGGGKDSLVAGNGTDLVQGYITQVVYLDFPTPTQTLPGDHTYTPLEEAAIQQGLESDFSAFNYFFTQVQTTAEQAAQTTGGQYATIEFDAPVVGGAANQLDPDNLSLGGVAQVNVTPFLGNESAGLVPPTSANIIGMTTTIAAHELGHLSGLQHQDALGPIGAGIFSGIDPTSFYPAYSAYATTTSVSSSAASGGGVTFTAAVAADDSNSGTPTGFVNFYDTTTNTDLMIETVARVSLTSNVATIATPTATSYAVGELVTVSGLSSAHSFFDGTYQITAVGSNSFSYALVHADVATIADSGTTDILGVPLVGGSASYAAQVAAGDVVNAVFVSYAGFAGSSSSQTISPTGTATTLTSSVSANGLSVVLAATVTGASGATIAGTVDFLDTTTNTDLTPGGIALVNGVATTSALSATALAGQNIMAVYLGTANLSGTANLAGSSATQTLSADAIETPFDVMASPDSVGSTLLDAAGANGPTYLGERDDVALAFNDTGAVQQKQNLPTETVAVSGVLPLTAQVLGEGADFAFNKEYVLGASGNLPSLAVPNTLPAGVPGAGTTFAVTATAVDATLAPGGADFYAFNGTAGEVMTFQVISNTNTQNAQPIIPELLVVGPGGQVIGYNVHEFESADSTLLDVTLPTNGQYYVGVDSLLNLSPSGGNYELFMYSFATSVSGATPSAGGDSLVGGTGNDTLMGSSGNDLFTVNSLSPNKTTITGGSGQYQIVNNTGNTTLFNPTPTPTTLTLLANLSSVVEGQPVIFTADVTATGANGGLPTGSVTFFDSTTQTPLGTVPLSVAGGVDQAVLPTVLPQLGANTITATYSSDSVFEYSYSQLTETVNKDATTTTETATITGQIVKLSATVAAKAPGSGTPTGSVDFFDSTTNTDLGSVMLSGGSASLTASLAPGSQTITATYSGDSNFLAGSGTISVAPAASIYVLNSTASGALTISGNAAINVPGVVDVDSNSSSALVASGNAVMTAASIQVVGSYSSSGNAKFTPKPTTGAASVADPFASLAIPSASGSSNGAVNISGNASQTIKPGIFSSITVSGNATLTMNAGTYVIEGGGLTISGNANVKGMGGVLIYNAGTKYPSAGGTFGAINISGNGTMSLSALTTGPDAGFVIFQSRDNTQAMTLSGNEITGLTGAVYAPSAALTLSGNATLKVALVVNKMTVSGNAIFNNVSLSDPAGIAYSPAQIRIAYGVNSLSLDGTGQTIAIVDAYDNPGIYQSLDQFDTQFGTTATGSTLYNQYGPASSFLTVLNQNGQPTGLPSIDPSGPGVANWEGEEALDVEWAHAVAPGSRIILVEANSQSLADLMSSVSTAASQPGVSVVAMSWGFTEGQAVFASDEANYDSYMTAPGVTFVASTGDYGAADPEYPAFSPNVVAVGGTSLTLNANGSYSSETGWGSANNSSGTFFGSGGGISQFEPEPAFQLGVQSTGARTTPDVSLIADPSTGAWIADTYNLTGSDPFEVVGGTSLSAPSWAGLIALANQGRAAAGQATLNATSPTQTQQALYSLPATDFNAVTVGNNGYSAGPGYNLVTGLGTPVANLLVTDLAAWNGTSTRQVVTVAPMQSVTPVNTGGNSRSSGPAAFQVFAFELGGVAGQGRSIGGNSGEGSSAIPDETSIPATGMEETATFSSAGVNGKSIAEGENQIELDGFAVSAIASGAAFIDSDAETSYRLYGDTADIAQRQVNSSDSAASLAAFNARSASAILLDFLDDDGNGRINSVEAGTQIVRERYSLDVCLPRMLDLYEDALHARGGRCATDQAFLSNPYFNSQARVARAGPGLVPSFSR